MVKRVFVAGHNGLVGSAIVRMLQHDATLILRDRTELDLTDATAVGAFFASERPDVVFLAAGKVGGIHADATAPWDLLYQNLDAHESVRARRQLQPGNVACAARAHPEVS